MGGSADADSPPLHPPEGRLGQRTWLKSEGGEEPGQACHISLTKARAP